MNPGYFESAKGGIVVSCQARKGGFMDDPHVIRAMSLACVEAGAAGVRVEGIECSRLVVSSVGRLVISLVKRSFGDGSVCITRSEEDFAGLAEGGSTFVAVDGTERDFGGFGGSDFVRMCSSRFPGVSVVADVSEEDEALRCWDAGAVAVATTLRGHTPWSAGRRGCDPDLIERLANRGVRVVAEGGIRTPSEMRMCLDSGAFFCVVGGAVTGVEDAVAMFASEARP